MSFFLTGERVGRHWKPSEHDSPRPGPVHLWSPERDQREMDRSHRKGWSEEGQTPGFLWLPEIPQWLQVWPLSWPCKMLALWHSFSSGIWQAFLRATLTRKRYMISIWSRLWEKLCQICSPCFSSSKMCYNHSILFFFFIVETCHLGSTAWWHWCLLTNSPRMSQEPRPYWSATRWGNMRVTAMGGKLSVYISSSSFQDQEPPRTQQAAFIYFVLIWKKKKLWKLCLKSSLFLIFSAVLCDFLSLISKDIYFGP